MKALIVMILYAIGMVTFMIWILGDAAIMSKVKEESKDEYWYRVLPEGVMYLVFVLVALVLSFIWPYVTARRLFNDLKGRSK